MEEAHKDLNKLAKKYPEYVFLCFERDKTMGEIVNDLNYHRWLK